MLAIPNIDGHGTLAGGRVQSAAQRRKNHREHNRATRNSG
jgi:hypothetical protein